MTNKEKAQMFEMRLDGHTLQEIGDKFGVSKQYVAQILPPMKHGYRALKSEMLGKIIYPNIRNWLKKNACTLKRFADETGTSYLTIIRALEDEKSGMRKTTIDKILEVTGLTYEEAFAMDQSESD